MDIGSRVGKLTVIEKAKQSWKLLVKCDCGETRLVNKCALRKGAYKTCGKAGCKKGSGKNSKGVQRKENPITKHPLYTIWSSMKYRCINRSNKDYGGRGIRVCDRWMDFYNFCTDMGLRPSSSHSIERINNDGDYEPSNCKWATPVEQAKNRRDCQRTNGLTNHMRKTLNI